MKNSKYFALATTVAILFTTASCSNMTTSNNSINPPEFVPVSNNCPNGCGENSCCQITPKNIAIAAKMRANNAK